MSSPWLKLYGAFHFVYNMALSLLRSRLATEGTLPREEKPMRGQHAREEEDADWQAQGGDGVVGVEEGKDDGAVGVEEGKGNPVVWVVDYLPWKMSGVDLRSHVNGANGDDGIVRAPRFPAPGRTEVAKRALTVTDSYSVIMLFVSCKKLQLFCNMDLITSNFMLQLIYVEGIHTMRSNVYIT